jgi:hypothetical protein
LILTSKPKKGNQERKLKEVAFTKQKEMQQKKGPNHYPFESWRLKNG